MTGFIILGVIAALVGILLVVSAIRGGANASPRNTAMLIGGMMFAAFGVVIAGFALVYQRTAPLELNAGAAQ